MRYRCKRPPLGWVCRKDAHHTGPCPAWPSWWNVPGRYWMRGGRRG